MLGGTASIPAVPGVVGARPRGAEILGEFKQEVSALETRGVNDVMNAMDEIFDRITTSDLVTERTLESHAAVDVGASTTRNGATAPTASASPTA